MPVDLTELLESVSAPPMHVDADTVVTRGRRRRLRRRLYGTAAVLGAAALIVPVADALRADGAPPPVPGISPPGDCVFAYDGADPWEVDGAGPQMAGTPWLDSGQPVGARTMRVQVNTDTCQGLAVAVTHGSSGIGATADVSGQPQVAFWVVDAVGGGVDKVGKVLPVKTTAVVLLPEGQRVCGIGTAPGADAAHGTSHSLSEPVTTAAGHHWQATFATITGPDNPQSTAVLRICEGARVVEPSLRPLNAIAGPGGTQWTRVPLP